jgi:hypothetical protein
VTLTRHQRGSREELPNDYIVSRKHCLIFLAAHGSCLNDVGKRIIASEMQIGAKTMEDAHKTKVAAYVAQWTAEGRWIDSGRWVPGNWGSKEYHPTRAEIRAKCKLFRTTPNRHGAHARAPRGGKYAVLRLAGIRREAITRSRP